MTKKAKAEIADKLVKLRNLLTLFASQKIVLGGFFFDVHSFLRYGAKKNEHPLKSPDWVFH
jgi:hypothetical protein